jgi:uncharacterized membrane protein YbhN (UPF0104 family)
MVIGIGANLSLAGVLFVLLDQPPVRFLAFAGASASSVGAGLLSGAPGGLGVFEGAMLTLSPEFDRAILAAAFLGYRLAYFLLPLALAVGLLAVREQPWKAKERTRLA